MTTNAIQQMPLAMAPDQALLQVVRVTGKPETIKRLSSMGVSTNSILQIVQHASGNLVIGIGNTRLAIAKSLAQKIMVCLETNS